MVAKKIKLQEETITEILLADTDLESGTDASDFEEDFEEEEEEEENNSKPQQKSKDRSQQVADYQSGDRLKEGTPIAILLSVQQKV